MAKKSTKKRKVRVAFIGAGGMANAVHYPSLAEMHDVEIVALADLFEEKREETAKKWNVKRTFPDYRSMLESVKCDAVYCIMPPQSPVRHRGRRAQARASFVYRETARDHDVSNRLAGASREKEQVHHPGRIQPPGSHR